MCDRSVALSAGSRQTSGLGEESPLSIAWAPCSPELTAVSQVTVTTDVLTAGGLQPTYLCGKYSIFEGNEDFSQ